MTMVIAGVLFLFFMLGTPGHIGMSPATLNESFGLDSTIPECREESHSEKFQRGGGDKGKATEFSLGGEYRCERHIFSYGERWEYINLVMQNIGRYAEYFAERIASLESRETFKSKPAYKVDVSDVLPMMRGKISQGFEGAISNALGSGRVVKRPLKGQNTAVVKVSLRDVADPDLLFRVSVEMPQADGDQKEVIWPL